MGWQLIPDHGELPGLDDDDHSAYVPTDGSRQFTKVDISGLTGATAGIRYVGGTTSGPPVSGTFAVGDVVVAENGGIYICTSAGTPGTWAPIGAGEGSLNVAVGPNAVNPGGVSGAANVGVGPSALAVVSSGAENTALGNSALDSLTTGSRNTAVGGAALADLVSGSDNIAIGWHALFKATASNSIAIGRNALGALTSGLNNLAIGYLAADAITTQANNIAIGAGALGTAGASVGDCVAIGASALNVANQGGMVGIGHQAGASLTTGLHSVAIGQQALHIPGGVGANATTTGARQVAIGYRTGQGSSTQRNNTVAIGQQALFDADNATAIGANSAANHADSVALGADVTTTAANQVAIEDRHIEMTEITAPGNGAANSARLYAVDDGAGKTQLAVVFGSGAVQVLATEP